MYRQFSGRLQQWRKFCWIIRLISLTAGDRATGPPPPWSSPSQQRGRTRHGARRTRDEQGKHRRSVRAITGLHLASISHHHVKRRPHQTAQRACNTCLARENQGGKTDYLKSQFTTVNHLLYVNCSQKESLVKQFYLFSRFWRILASFTFIHLNSERTWKLHINL